MEVIESISTTVGKFHVVQTDAGFFASSAAAPATPLTQSYSDPEVVRNYIRGAEAGKAAPLK